MCKLLCLVALLSSMSLNTVIPQGPFESNGRKQMSLSSCGLGFDPFRPVQNHSSLSSSMGHVVPQSASALTWSTPCLGLYMFRHFVFHCKNDLPSSPSPPTPTPPSQRHRTLRTSQARIIPGNNPWEPWTPRSSTPSIFDILTMNWIHEHSSLICKVREPDQDADPTLSFPDARKRESGVRVLPQCVPSPRIAWRSSDNQSPEATHSDELVN